MWGRPAGPSAGANTLIHETKLPYETDSYLNMLPDDAKNTERCKVIGTIRTIAKRARHNAVVVRQMSKKSSPRKWKAMRQRRD